MNTKTQSGSIKISVNIPEKFLIDLDKNRKELMLSRSNWVTSAIMEKLAKLKQDN